MYSGRLTELRDKFETLSVRLQETQDFSERQGIIKEARKIIEETNVLVEAQQAALQRKLAEVRHLDR